MFIHSSTNQLCYLRMFCLAQVIFYLYHHWLASTVISSQMSQHLSPTTVWMPIIDPDLNQKISTSPYLYCCTHVYFCCTCTLCMIFWFEAQRQIMKTDNFLPLTNPWGCDYCKSGLFQIKDILQWSKMLIAVHCKSISELWHMFCSCLYNIKNE